MGIVKKVLGIAGTFLTGGLAGLGMKALSGKKPAAASPLPQAQRDDVAALAEREDELRRRRGASADIITGSGGAEATGRPGKFVLGN